MRRTAGRIKAPRSRGAVTAQLEAAAGASRQRWRTALGGPPRDEVIERLRAGRRRRWRRELAENLLPLGVRPVRGGQGAALRPGAEIRPVRDHRLMEC